ncbi:CDP-diacylglycerol--serine O-phosphatidyltransferase, partial [Rhodococcus erythropolis]|nr:CDP-diacylglycerol--serine O-phosphatidyltransferase [Rhodococcus erythropolis]
ELDSLADSISFGVAPALVLYVTLLDGTSIGWIIALIYAVSIVLRLARFNTLLDDDDVPAYAREYFVGVPAPAGALIALTPLAATAQ